MNTEPETHSDSGADSEQESLDIVVSELKQQMNTIERVSNELTVHITDLFQRTKRETTDWMHEPLKPQEHIEGWCAQHGLRPTPTLDEFIEACFATATFMDLETRIATFKKEDADVLWKGKRRISVFEILSSIPTLFH
jgi:hypothetical protein